MAEPACRICGEPLTVTFVDLGMAPPCQDFLTEDRLDSGEAFYPLNTRVCSNCLLVQLPAYLAADELFTDDYAYFSSFSSSWLKHAEKYATKMIAELGLGPDSLVVEAASNDGYLLQYFDAAGVPVVGIEPTGGVAKAAIAKGIRTEQVFLGRQTGEEIAAKYGQADLVAGNNVFAHVPDVVDFVAGLAAVLKPGGTLTLEFPHLMRLIEMRQFDTIYHEHYSYYTLLTAQRALATGGLVVTDVEELSSHGGSLRVYAMHSAAATQPSPAVADLLEREAAAGLHTLSGYADFAPQVQRVKDDLLAFLLQARKDGKRVIGYGAAGKGMTFLNYAGIKPDLLPCIVDRNYHKHGLYCPGSHIPVRPVAELLAEKPDYVFILPWNLGPEIAGELAEIGEWGGQFITAIPELKVWAPPMKVVLFCGGYGMRMRDGVTDLPKPMVQIGHRPLLWHVMRYYAHYGHTDFILALGYGAHHIKQFFLDYRETDSNNFVLSGDGSVDLLSRDISDWNITFVDTGRESQIGERLRRVAPHLEGEEMFLANYADILSDVPIDDMVDQLAKSDAAGILLAAPATQSFHILETEERHVTGITPVRRFPIRINGGYFVFRPDILDQIKPGEDLEEGAFSRLAEQRRLLNYRYDGFWKPADTVKERAELDAMFNRGDRPWAKWEA